MPRQLSRRREARDLALLVPSLPAEALQRVIDDRGLDASADLLAAATPSQIARVLDLDVWRAPQPGQDSRLDAARVFEWIETLADYDVTATARVVASSDPRVIAAALARVIRVFDPGVFQPTAQTDDEPSASSWDNMRGPSTSVGGYLVAFREAGDSDALVAVLVAMEEAHTEAFHALMQSCRALSNSTPEIEGDDDLPGAQDQAEYDLASERRSRQARAGYVPSDDARAFLAAVRRSSGTGATDEARHPVVADFLRSVDDALRTVGPLDTEVSLNEPSPTIADDVLGLDPVDAGREQMLLPNAGDEAPDRYPLVSALLTRLYEADRRAYFEATHQLAFLANAIAAGCSLQSRAFTPREASEASVATCHLGLECEGASDLITAFERGWAILHAHVSVRTAERLQRAIETLRCRDAELLTGLHRVRLSVIRARAAGTPWTVRDQLDPLAILDMPSWTALLGLLSECPVIPAALTAIVGRQTTAIDPSAFAFIGTRTQLDDIARFLERLPTLLEQGA